MRDGIRLVLPVQAGGLGVEVALEPAHHERLFRASCLRAIRDGLLEPSDEVCARLVPGAVHGRHGEVLCMASCGVELTRPDGEIVTTVDFSRETFAAFAAARAVHCLAESGASLDTPIQFSLHAEPDTLDALPVALPALPFVSLPALLRQATTWATPDASWIVTAIGPRVIAGLAELEHASRTTRVETAGRIIGRAGFDPERRLFVRMLDRLLVTRSTEASATEVVSTPQSWAEVLDASDTAVRVFSSAHTHMHMDESRDDIAVDNPADDGGDLGASSAPCASLPDLISHYISLPDPLSAMLILSLYPGGRRVVALYGYGDDALLRAERGWWLLPEEPAHAYEGCC